MLPKKANGKRQRKAAEDSAMDKPEVGCQVPSMLPGDAQCHTSALYFEASDVLT